MPKASPKKKQVAAAAGPPQPFLILPAYLSLSAKAAQMWAVFLCLFEIRTIFAIKLEGQPFEKVVQTLGPNPSAQHQLYFLCFIAFLGLVRFFFAIRPFDKTAAMINGVVHVVEIPIVGWVLSQFAVPDLMTKARAAGGITANFVVKDYFLIVVALIIVANGAVFWNWWQQVATDSVRAPSRLPPLSPSYSGSLHVESYSSGSTSAASSSDSSSPTPSPPPRRRPAAKKGRGKK